MIYVVWKIRVGSRDDGNRIMDLPVRGTYLIESRHKNGYVTLAMKAKALAAEDGIPNPIVLSGERLTR